MDGISFQIFPRPLTASVRDIFVLYNTLMFLKTMKERLNESARRAPSRRGRCFGFALLYSFAYLATFSPNLETLEFFFSPVLLKTLLVSKREWREMLKTQKSFEFDILM